MSQYRNALPQLGGGMFLTDGGIETSLIYHQGFELPHFAAFDLLKCEEGTEALRAYYWPYAELASQFDVGCILESPTWRCSSDWGARLGYPPESLGDVNRKAIRLMEEIRDDLERSKPFVISGCVGPRGDGYLVDFAMSAEEAEEYHLDQIEAFAGTAADMVTAITMNYAEEAIGITRAAERAGMPVAISFTLETDGRLPTGQGLGEAIDQVDDVTGVYPAYYMINCAHPTHFMLTLTERGTWLDRIRGLRANASRKSHAELDQATELDPGDPAELGREYATIMMSLRNLNVFGGCCGTDSRHIEQIALSCKPLFRRTARVEVGPGLSRGPYPG